MSSPTTTFDTEFTPRLKFQLDGLTQVPVDYIPDALAVITMPGHNWGRPAAPAFAAIIALQPGDVIAAKPRTCITVSLKPDGTHLYENGVFAVKDASDWITSDVPWPEMSKALTHEPKPLWPLTRPKAGLAPHTAVKNWHEGDSYWEASDKYESSDTAVLALHILALWNGWEKKKLPWINRVERLAKAEATTNPKVLAVLETATTQNKALARLQGFCGELGLREGHQTDFQKPNGVLQAALLVAQEVARRQSVDR